MIRENICIHVSKKFVHKILCEQYWELKENYSFKYKIHELCREYQITSQSLKTILHENCYITLLTRSCPICGENVRIFTRKQYTSYYTNNSNMIENVCEHCHILMTNNYFTHLSTLPNTVNLNPNVLSYEAAVKMYAGLQYVQKTLKPYRNPQGNPPILDKISILEDVHNEILFNLLHLNLIYPATPIDLIKFQYGSKNLYNTDICWRIVPEKKYYYPFINIIKTKFIHHSRSHYQMIHEMLCYEVAYEECLHYLQQELSDYNFHKKFLMKIKPILHEYLTLFSVKQIKNIMYDVIQSAKNSPKPYKRIIPIIIELLKDDKDYFKHIDEEFSIENNHPNKQSHINNILFDQVFKKHHCGFNKPLQQLFK